VADAGLQPDHSRAPLRGQGQDLVGELGDRETSTASNGSATLARSGWAATPSELLSFGLIGITRIPLACIIRGISKAGWAPCSSSFMPTTATVRRARTIAASSSSPSTMRPLMPPL